MTTMPQLIGLVASLVIFWRVEPALNLMGPQCRLPIRLAFWLLAVGAAGLGLVITQGYVPNIPITLAVAGMALLLLCERRLHGLFNRHSAL